LPAQLFSFLACTPPKNRGMKDAFRCPAFAQ
jgi:hypothetical protein